MSSTPIPTPPSAQELRRMISELLRTQESCESCGNAYFNEAEAIRERAYALIEEKAEALERGAETRAGGQNELAWLESGKDSLPDRDLIDILAAKLAAERALSDKLAAMLRIICADFSRDYPKSVKQLERALAAHAEARKQP